MEAPQVDGYYTTAGDYGIRTLFEPTDALSTGIVLVHGLTGNRERTWTDRETGLFWPEQLLPTEFPRARIITYGYDADIVRLLDASSSNTLRDHGKALAIDLAQRRARTESDNRPVIFIAHSLGGLVCEQALLISGGAAEQYLQKLLECTKGLLFMGTPHAGSDLARWGGILTSLSAVLKKTNQALVRVLEPGSEVLANLQEQFHVMINGRRMIGKPTLDMFCFFEELGVTGVGTIVSKHSAILPAYQNRGIHGNHMGMTKFKGNNDSGYQAVSGQIWLWIREIEVENARNIVPTQLVPRLSSSDFRMRNELEELQKLLPFEGEVNSQSINNLIDRTWKVYRLCSESNEVFNTVCAEIISLHVALKVTYDQLSEVFLAPRYKSDFQRLCEGCDFTLHDLQSVIARYEGLDAQSQRTWDRMRYDREIVSELRYRLTGHTAMLTTLNNTISNQSQARVVASLEKLISEVLAGKRVRSISAQSIESISADNKETWRQLRRELEDIGISSKVLNERRPFIVKYIMAAVDAGRLEEQQLTPMEIDATNPEKQSDIETSSTSLEIWHETSQNMSEYYIMSDSLAEQPKSAQRVTERPPAPIEHSPSRTLSPLESSLIKASRQGHVTDIQNIIDSEVDINAMSSSGELALHVAAARGHEEAVTLLLQHGADILAKDGNEWTALRWSVGMGHEGLVRMLLEKGADKEAKDGDGWTVLHWAARRGHNVFVKLLLESGADPNTKDSGGFAALHLAAWHGYTVIVQLLVEMGADLLLQDWWGDTALDLAARRKHENVIGILLEAARTRGDANAFGGLEDKSDTIMKFLVRPDIFDMFWKDSGSLQGITDEEAKRWFSERYLQNELVDELLEYTSNRHES